MNLILKFLIFRLSVLDDAALHLKHHVTRFIDTINLKEFLTQRRRRGLEEKAMISSVALLFSFVAGILDLLVIQRNPKDEWIAHSLYSASRVTLFK